MLIRTLVGVILAPLFFCILYFLPFYYLGALLIVLCCYGSQELLRAAKFDKGSDLFYKISIVAALVPAWIGQFSLGLGVGMAAMLLLVYLFGRAILYFGSDKEMAFETLLYCFFAGVIFPALLSSLLLLRMMELGQYLVFLPVLTTFATDTGAYFVGVLFGKHRGVTQVSPNKSLEGYVGGIFFGLGVLFLYAFFLQRYQIFSVNFPLLLVYGLLGSVVTEMGDLSFSMIKRQKGIKDFGNLLPGHGGIVDRFDSMCFSAPIFALLLEIIPAFSPL